MRETGRSGFKRKFMDELEERYPGCILLHLDPNGNFQGIPDLLMLWGGLWAAFEVKASANAARRPNQPYYVEQFNHLSFAAFVYPENQEAVLHELEKEFSARGAARPS